MNGGGRSLSDLLAAGVPIDDLVEHADRRRRAWARDVYEEEREDPRSNPAFGTSLEGTFVAGVDRAVDGEDAAIVATIDTSTGEVLGSFVRGVVSSSFSRGETDAPTADDLRGHVQAVFGRLSTQPGSYARMMLGLMNAMVDAIDHQQRQIDAVRCREHDECRASADMGMACAASRAIDAAGGARPFVARAPVEDRDCPLCRHHVSDSTKRVVIVFGAPPILYAYFHEWCRPENLPAWCAARAETLRLPCGAVPPVSTHSFTPER